jgi:Skp family chaperone for outer membrane proteins
MTTSPSLPRDLLVFVAVACLGASFAVPRLVAQDPVGKAPVTVDAKAARATPAGPVLGTVDLVKAFDQYPKWIQLKGELAKMSEQFEDQIKQLTKRLDELRATINATAPDSDERKRAEFELDLGLQQRQWLAKTLRDKARAEEAKALLAVYEDVEAAVAVVARNRGVALVQRVHELGPSPGDIGKLGAKEVENRLMAFERKQVWFAAAEIDLTDDLIKQLMVPVAGGSKPTGAAPPKPAAEPKPAGEAGRGGS